MRKSTIESTTSENCPPSTSELSDKYWGMSDAEWEKLVDECKSADVAKTAPEHIGGSFGLKPRAQERLMVRQQEKDFAKSLVQTLALPDEELDSKQVCTRISMQHAMSNPACNDLNKLVANATRYNRALAVLREEPDVAD